MTVIPKAEPVILGDTGPNIALVAHGEIQDRKYELRQAVYAEMQKGVVGPATMFMMYNSIPSQVEIKDIRTESNRIPEMDRSANTGLMELISSNPKVLQETRYAAKKLNEHNFFYEGIELAKRLYNECKEGSAAVITSLASMAQVHDQEQWQRFFRLMYGYFNDKLDEFDNYEDTDKMWNDIAGWAWDHDLAWDASAILDDKRPLHRFFAVEGWDPGAKIDNDILQRWLKVYTKELKKYAVQYNQPELNEFGTTIGKFVWHQDPRFGSYRQCSPWTRIDPNIVRYTTEMIMFKHSGKSTPLERALIEVKRREEFDEANRVMKHKMLTAALYGMLKLNPGYKYQVYRDSDTLVDELTEESLQQ